MQNIGLSVFPEHTHIFLGIVNGNLKMDQLCSGKMHTDIKSTEKEKYHF